MKRYIYIIIGIIVAAVIAILVLLFIKNRSASTVTTTVGTGSLPAVGTQTTSSSTQGAGSANATPSTVLTLSSNSSTAGQTNAVTFGVLSNSPVLDYFVDPQNNITAIQPNGQVVTVANGQASIVNSSSIDDIISASFSYDGKKILVTYGDPTSPQATLFNAATQTWTLLSERMQSPQWSPDNYQIAYLSSGAAGSGKVSLSMINAASLNSGVATLLTLNANDMNLAWVSKNQFVLSDKPSAYNAGSIWLFNSTTGALTPLVYEEDGAEAIWNNGTSSLGLVFSDSSNGQSSNLRLETTAGAVEQNLNFLTLPSKCLFAGLELYCGIPRTSSGFSSAQLPDDYNTMALFTSDDIYEINTTSGGTQNLWSDQTQNIDTSDLKITNDTLFFINRYNQELYGLILPQ
jgi:hypothetical protein